MRLERSRPKGPGVVAAFAAACVLAATSVRPQTEADLGKAAERASLETLERQGASHASGQRPELGPTLQSRVVAADAGRLRVGLSPTAFNDDGSVRLEYDTAAGHNHQRIEIGGAGPFSVIDEAGELLANLGAGQTAVFTPVSGAELGVSLPLGAGLRRSGPLRVRSAAADQPLVVLSMRRLNRLEPPVAGSFPLTPAVYRGELEVLRSEADSARLRLVNVVDVEPYVAGVVVNESLSSFHVEALRAQAVAARGYALANVGRFASRGFDIDDSTLSQVYRGQSSETAAAIEAAQGTEGLVASHDGRILQALYSSSMGGHTEDNEYVFPVGGYPGQNADPALRGVHDSPEPLRQDLGTADGVLSYYSTNDSGAYESSPTTGAPLTSLHRWTRTRSAAELLARLKDPSRGWGVPATASELHEIDVVLRGRSGRMMQVVVAGDWGRTTISGWSDLRALATLAGTTPGGTTAASAPNSPSALSLTRDVAGRVAQVTLFGGGFGHNVGMSQYGSQGRALRGQDFAQILAGYYSGMRIGTAPTLLAAGGLPAETSFVAPAGRAVLRIESYGLAGLELELNGRRFVVAPRGMESSELDLSSFLRPGRNRMAVVPTAGRGAAVVQVQIDREPQRAPGRR